MSLRNKSLAFSAALVCLAGIAWGWGEFQFRRSVKEGTQYLAQGYGHLAWTTLRPHRDRLLSETKYCPVFINSALESESWSDVAWAAEACRSGGFEGLDPELAMAIASEKQKLPDRAAVWAERAMRRSPKDLRPYIFLSRLLREKAPEESLKWLLQATQLNPNDAQLALDAANALASRGDWAAARQFADRLVNEQTQDPAVKLLIARILLNSGDKPRARAVRQVAEEWMKRLPQDQYQRLRNEYVDVFHEVSAAARGQLGTR